MGGRKLGVGIRANHLLTWERLFAERRTETIVKGKSNASPRRAQTLRGQDLPWEHLEVGGGPDPVALPSRRPSVTVLPHS